MYTSRKKRISRKWLVAVLAVGVVLVATWIYTGHVVSHQPLLKRQMQRLITPEDPAVVQTLQGILDAPLPEITAQNAYLAYEGWEQDFNRIVDWVNVNIRYIADEDNQGIEDYWQLPSETLAFRQGDCEDYAILLCSLLRAYGVPSDQVYVGIGETLNRVDHAWLLERYYKGVWRLFDSTNRMPLIVGETTSNYHADLCFNDKIGISGVPKLPAGVYEFELPLGGNFTKLSPLILTAEIDDSTYADNVSSITYTGRCAAGKKISVSVEWLPDSIYSDVSTPIEYSWGLYVYNQSGARIFAWDSKETSRTVEFEVLSTGYYEVEIVKRDRPARCVRLTLSTPGWEIQDLADIFHTPPSAIPSLEVLFLEGKQPDGKYTGDLNLVNPTLAEAKERMGRLWVPNYLPESWKLRNFEVRGDYMAMFLYNNTNGSILIGEGFSSRVHYPSGEIDIYTIGSDAVHVIDGSWVPDSWEQVSELKWREGQDPSLYYQIDGYVIHIMTTDDELSTGELLKLAASLTEY